MPLRLNLFGPPVGQIENNLLQIHKFKKPFALLCYVSMQNGPVSRLQLATLLWPDFTESKALMNLRKALTTLRREVGDYIQANFHEVWINQDLPFDLDIELITNQSSPKTVQPTALIKLHRGEFLEGFFIRSSEPFEGWVAQQHRSLERQYLARLGTLADHCAASGLFDKAIACGQKQLEIDHLQEKVHQNLMRWFGLSGNRIKALDQYDTCAEILANELGLQPSLEMKVLRQQILEGRLTSPSEPTDNTRPELKRPTKKPFFGRQQELAKLEEILDLGCQQSGQIFFVAGEAGQGKTRLLSEFAYQALLKNSDLIILFGQNDTFAAVGDAYLTFREILNQLIGLSANGYFPAELDSAQFKNRLAPLTTRHIKAMLYHGRLLFHTFLDGASFINQHPFRKLDNLLQDEFINLVNTPPISPIQSEQIYSQLAKVLEIISAERPILILFDNLQWASEASVQLLYFLSQRLKHSQVTFVGAFRSDELLLNASVADRPLAKVLSEIKAEYGNVFMDLADADPIDFVDHFINHQANKLNQDFRQNLIRKTNGHPLFTIELFASLIQHRDLLKDSEGHWVEAPSISWNHMPVRVEGIISQKVGRLDFELQEILSLASVFGKEFTAELLAIALNTDPAYVINRLNDPHLKSQRLVNFVEMINLDGLHESRYQFHHDLIQQYLYTSMDDAQRHYFHHRVAKSLEDQFTNNRTAVSHHLAFHFTQCQAWQEALDYICLTVDREQKKFAYPELKVLTRKGLDLLEHLPDTPERTFSELFLYSAYGTAYMLTEGHGSSKAGEAFERQYELSQKLPNAGYAFPALSGLWVYFLAAGNHRKAFNLGRQLVSIADNHLKNLQYTMSGYFSLGLTHFFEGNFKQAKHNLSISAKLVTSVKIQIDQEFYVFGHDPSLLSSYYLALTEAFLGNFQTALSLLNKEISHKDTAENPYSVAFALVLKQYLHYLLNDTQTILMESPALIVACQKHQFTQLLGQSIFVYGWALGITKDTDLALNQFEVAFALYEDIRIKLGLSSFFAFRAEVYLESNQTRLSLASLDQARSNLPFGGKFWEPEVYRLTAQCYDRLSHTNEDIEKTYIKAIQSAQSQGSKLFHLKAAMDFVHYLGKKNMHTEAYECLSAAYNSFNEGFESQLLQKAKSVLDELAQEMIQPPAQNNIPIQPPT